MITIDLSGKNVVITGAGGGIGRGIARRYGAAGAKVWVTDLSEEKAAETAEILKKEGAVAVSSKLDVTNEDDIIALMDRVVKEDGKIDNLCTCAGIMYSSPYMDTKKENLEKSCAINLVGVDSCCRAALRHMLPRKEGRIVNIASGSTRKGNPIIAHYCGPKMGVMGLSQSIALAVADQGINVNCICPGLVNTDMGPAMFGFMAELAGVPYDDYIKGVEARALPNKRLQTPEEIGDCAVFLSSDLAYSITGQAINVDGAMNMN